MTTTATHSPAQKPATPSKSFEIEVKSLLGGDKSVAQALEAKLHQHFADLKPVEDSQQLNHYFQGEALPALLPLLSPHLSAAQANELAELSKSATSYSVRTRQLADKNQTPKVIFVLKASIDDTTSQNGISRREFEADLSSAMSLDELDELILQAGFEYQAKWSRDRRAFTSPTQQVTVSIDRNAGYGYIAEFEKVVNSESEAESAVSQIRQLISELNVTELAQDRLERMFAHYNAHWPEYYGTDKTFTIE